jgi:hypothetical protein
LFGPPGFPILGPPGPDGISISAGVFPVGIAKPPGVTMMPAPPVPPAPPPPPELPFGGEPPGGNTGVGPVPAPGAGSAFGPPAVVPGFARGVGPPDAVPAFGSGVGPPGIVPAVGSGAAPPRTVPAFGRRIGAPGPPLFTTGFGFALIVAEFPPGLPAAPGAVISSKLCAPAMIPCGSQPDLIPPTVPPGLARSASRACHRSPPASEKLSPLPIF